MRVVAVASGNATMPHVGIPNYRQQRALDAVERAATELSMTIKGHAPDTDTVREALRVLGALTDSVKAAILDDQS
jgi:hypothetical protein